MIRIGIDTLVLIAHDAEVAVFDCVLAEAISLADYPTDDILWVLPDVPVLYGGIIELVRSSGGELNFNDALIALSCRHRGILLIASFDRDFDQLTWLQRVAQPDDLS